MPDVNGDGKLDVVGTSLFFGGVWVYLGNGDGTFPSFPQQTDGLYSASGFGLADFNGDGKVDVLLGHSDPSGNAFLMLGKGDGTFQAATMLGGAGGSTHGIAIADVNGDGLVDAVVSAESDRGYSFISNGDGTFRPAMQFLSRPLGKLAVADLDGDGKADLVSAAYGSSMSGLDVLIGNGTGRFLDSLTLATGSTPSASRLADVNGDGKADLIVAQKAAAMLTVFINQAQ